MSLGSAMHQKPEVPGARQEGEVKPSPKRYVMKHIRRDVELKAQCEKERSVAGVLVLCELKKSAWLLRHETD